jgi:hypothetical protein
MEVESITHLLTNNVNWSSWNFFKIHYFVNMFFYCCWINYPSLNWIYWLILYIIQYKFGLFEYPKWKHSAPYVFTFKKVLNSLLNMADFYDLRETLHASVLDRNWNFKENNSEISCHHCELYKEEKEKSLASKRKVYSRGHKICIVIGHFTFTSRLSPALNLKHLS